jgi:hypothetical protein
MEWRNGATSGRGGTYAQKGRGQGGTKDRERPRPRQDNDCRARFPHSSVQHACERWSYAPATPFASCGVSFKAEKTTESVSQAYQANGPMYPGVQAYALSWIPLMPNGVMGHTVDACMEEARHACFWMLWRSGLYLGHPAREPNEGRGQHDSHVSGVQPKTTPITCPPPMLCRRATDSSRLRISHRVPPLARMSRSHTPN